MPTFNMDHLMALWGIAECSDGFRKAQSPYSFAVRNFLPSLSMGIGRGIMPSPFGLSMSNTIGMVCLFRYAHDLA